MSVVLFVAVVRGRTTDFKTQDCASLADRQRSDYPKRLGRLLSAMVNQNLQITEKDIQEDSPNEIGRAIASWMSELG
jgi:hypothetical protein